MRKIVVTPLAYCDLSPLFRESGDEAVTKIAVKHGYEFNEIDIDRIYPCGIVLDNSVHLPPKYQFVKFGVLNNNREELVKFKPLIERYYLSGDFNEIYIKFDREVTPDFNPEHCFIAIRSKYYDLLKERIKMTPLVEVELPDESRWILFFNRGFVIR